MLDPEATFRPKVREGSYSVLSMSGHAADPWRRSHGGESEAGDGGRGGDGRAGREGRPLSIWEVQYKEAQQRRAERQLLQQLYEVDEKRECSHKPFVCDTSRAIDREARKRTASATYAASLTHSTISR